MINTIFLIGGLVPVGLGLGFILKPAKMRKAQGWFRKRLERMEKRFYKAHKRIGLYFLTVGVLMIFTYFQPIWIYNMFYVSRLVMGFFFPELFNQMQQVEGTPMVCI